MSMPVAMCLKKINTDDRLCYFNGNGFGKGVGNDFGNNFSSGANFGTALA
jgi:hypothetical protein